MLTLEIVKQVLASDIISWVLAFMGGFIVFRIVDNMQTKIERHNVIKEIESSINTLFSLPIAKSNMNVKEEISNVNVRTVLLDQTSWESYKKNQTKIIIEDYQRFIQIRSLNGYEEYISTQAIHESLILFRRIEKLYKDKILQPIDLADMWREVLPFGTSGRLEFYKSYLGDSDIKSIIFVLFNTFLACKKYGIDNAVNGFKCAFQANEEMQKYYFSNNRYTLREELKVYRFKTLMK